MRSRMRTSGRGSAVLLRRRDRMPRCRRRDFSAARSAAAARKVPEQPISGLEGEAARSLSAVEPEKDTWYLPDAAVSVVTTPNPEGGVTYLFDDVTKVWTGTAI